MMILKKWHRFKNGIMCSVVLSPYDLEKCKTEMHLKSLINLKAENAKKGLLALALGKY